MDKYKKNREIGSGYFSTVYETYSEQINEFVALKTLKPEFLHNPDYKDYVYRFKREINIMKELNGHPNIMTIYDHSVENNPWYVMPIAGGSLENRQIIEQVGIAFIFKEILKGMKYAHSKNKLHRDLAPSNILIKNNNGDIQVIISDFGLAKDFTSLSKFTHSSVSLYGHLHYSAPEQIESLKNATVRSDIYSLGCILYYMLTGKQPITISELTDYDIIIRKCISPNTKDRYSSIEELEEALAKLLNLLNRKNDYSGIYTLKDMFQELNRDTDGVDDEKLLQLHTILKDGLYQEHIYHDYIDPIIENLNDELLIKYYNYAKADFKQFLDRFHLRLRELYNQTRWPFSRLDNVGGFLYNLYKILEDEDLKIECFKEMFYIAFYSDQWHVQRLVANVISETMSRTMENSISMFILSEDKSMIEKLYDNVKGKSININIKKVIIDRL